MFLQGDADKSNFSYTSAFLASVFSTAVMHPIDTIKIRLMSSNENVGHALSSSSDKSQSIQVTPPPDPVNTSAGEGKPDPLTSRLEQTGAGAWSARSGEVVFKIDNNVARGGEANGRGGASFATSGQKARTCKRSCYFAVAAAAIAAAPPLPLPLPPPPLSLPPPPPPVPLHPPPSSKPSCPLLHRHCHCGTLLMQLQAEALLGALGGAIGAFVRRGARKRQHRQHQQRGMSSALLSFAISPEKRRWRRGVGCRRRERREEGTGAEVEVEAVEEVRRKGKKGGERKERGGEGKAMEGREREGGERRGEEGRGGRQWRRGVFDSSDDDGSILLHPSVRSHGGIVTTPSRTQELL
eukprot:754490-Hanusia_phi.AAC.6